LIYLPYELIILVPVLQAQPLPSTPTDAAAAEEARIEALAAGLIAGGGGTSASTSSAPTNRPTLKAGTEGKASALFGKLFKPK
jgi:hypothetical protein